MLLGKEKGMLLSEIRDATALLLKDRERMKLSFLGGCKEAGKVIYFCVKRKQRRRFP